MKGYMIITQNNIRSSAFKLAIWIITTLSVLHSPVVNALAFTLPSNGDNVVGDVQETIVEPGDDLHSIARRYDVGYYELVEANPTVDPDNVKSWITLTVPTRFILPDTAHTGIVVSLVELRLYYYPPEQPNLVITYPIGIGRQGWQTPVGETKVIGKKQNPTWVVPPSIMEDSIKNGTPLPSSQVPPGPDNPLGAYALRLALPSYLIHGTNHPEAIGTRSTAGCIRVYPEDIQKLFERVSVGTVVHLVDSPYKVGWSDGKLYLEAHLPLQEQQEKLNKDSTILNNYVTQEAKKHKIQVDWSKVREVAKTDDGIPHEIGDLMTAISEQEQKPDVVTAEGMNAVTTQQPNLPPVVEIK
jgi:L,D-transpeptidase ErfK/SrfK